MIAVDEKARESATHPRYSQPDPDRIAARNDNGLGVPGVAERIHCGAKFGDVSVNCRDLPDSDGLQIMVNTSEIKKLLAPVIPATLLRWYRLRYYKSRYGIDVRFKPKSIEICRDGQIIRIGRTRELFLHDMATSFDSYFGAVHPVDGVADFSGPRSHRLVGFDDYPLVFPSVPEPYFTIKQYLEFASLKPGEVVFDLGAYAGVTSLAFAREVGASGAVFAFEADAENFRVATENVATAAALKYPSPTLIHSAVWSHNDGLDFSAEGWMGSSATSIVGNGRGSIVKVPSTTLATFVAKRGISQVDFIKIDIEGAEIEVLDSSRDLLSRMRPKLMIEPHMVGDCFSTQRCCGVLREIGGYDIRIVDQPGMAFPLIEATPLAL